MLKRYIRKNVYKWHRWSSLIVAIPVLLWTVSGFLYPILNSKPNVPAANLSPVTIDREKITVSLQQALVMNHLDSIGNFRIVQIKAGFYYQVEQPGKKELLYIDCRSGSILPGGDQLYAIWLAHRMMTEKASGGHNDHTSHGQNSELHFASESKLLERSFTPVLSVNRITSFNKEYKASQRILPVYKIDLDREDNLRLYIDTRTSRLSVSVDDKKAWFDWFFGVTHTWSFLDGIGKLKHVVLGIFSAFCLFTAISGLYVYLVIRKKKPGSKQKKNISVYTHRILGYTVLLTTALYGFSGAWHAFRKVVPANTIRKNLERSFSSADLALSLDAVNSGIRRGEKLADISVVQLNDKIYWQITCCGKNNV
ncbi:MAG TPA: PepSY domain-containing protein, partial [Chitinophagaceae bacterium]|nr:PepSY domain-containing protein [Chitinophagaceae bacterium]